MMISEDHSPQLFKAAVDSHFGPAHRELKGGGDFLHGETFVEMKHDRLTVIPGDLSQRTLDLL
jgi:hypothetical protein